LQQDFEKCNNEHSVYVKRSESRPILLICLYADDLLITGCDEVEIAKFKSRMKVKFEMSDLGMLSYFLGIEFVTTNSGVFMQ
jgi:hypothetical protein